MSARSTRLGYALAAIALDYPDRQRLALARDALPELAKAQRKAFTPLITELLSGPQGERASHYVDLFDSTPGCTLYLTWYTDGDTRRRGNSLAVLKGRYREHGFRLEGTELPDYLPMMLEFAAHTGTPGRDLLAGFRPALVRLCDKLSTMDGKYADAVQAVLATLPADKAAPITEQPPVEQVGVLLGYPTGLGGNR